MPIIGVARKAPASSVADLFLCFQVPVNANGITAEVLLKGMSREKSSPSARCRSFFLGIQPNRSNVRCESGLARVLRSWRVAACEAENQFFFPVVPFRCCDGANRFVKQQA